MRKLTLLAVAALLLGACGGDDGGDEAAEPAEGSTTTSTAADDAEPEFTGDPVRLMVISDVQGLGEDFSNAEGGALAAAEAINADGGIDGRPLEVELCDAARNANDAAACARRAVDDGFAAVVGSTTTQGAAYLPILEDAGIPSIANLGVGGVDFQSTIAYPITLGTAGYAVAMGSLSADIGAQQIGVAYVDIEGGALAAAAVGMGVAPNGGTVANQIPVAPNTPDMSTAVAASTDGVDAVALGLTTADATRFVQAARQSGAEVEIIAPQAALDPTSIEQLGDDAEGVYLTSFFLPVSEEYDEMDDVVADFDAASVEFVQDDVAVNAWAGVQLFALAAADASDLTGPSISAALDALGEIDLGIVPAFSFQEAVPGIPTFERTFNPFVLFNRVERGVTVPVTGEFVNPFLPLAG